MILLLVFYRVTSIHLEHLHTCGENRNRDRPACEVAGTPPRLWGKPAK